MLYYEYCLTPKNRKKVKITCHIIIAALGDKPLWSLTLNLIGWIKQTYHTAKENTKQHMSKSINYKWPSTQRRGNSQVLSSRQSLNTI